MTKEELNKILENHMHWLNEDCDGWENMKADFRYADLYGSDLSYANLRYVDFRDANLRYANLRDANLSGADLRYANLRDANLSGADLRDADLRYANLRYADLRYANLSYVDFRDANLYGADLSYADLRYANLCDANLRDANLRGANLYGANLSDAKNVPFIPYACPDFGSFIGYKKASEYIVELEIPEDAKRLSATTRKCRCNKAKVLRILNYDRTVADVTKVRSNYNRDFVYKVGDIVSVDNFDEDRFNECSTGIHFFINFHEAVDY